MKSSVRLPYLHNTFSKHKCMYDAGIEINKKEAKNTIFSIARKKVRYFDDNFIVKTVPYDKLPKNIEFSFSHVLFHIYYSYETGHYIANEYKCEHDSRVIFIGYKWGVDGKKHRYENIYLDAMLLGKLNDGDHIDKLFTLAKCTYYGEKTEKRENEKKEKMKLLGITEEFTKEVSCHPKVRFYDGARPYFYCTYTGTSRVDINFCKTHKKEFWKMAIMKLEDTPSFISLGLPINCYKLERFSLAADKTIELVFGIKPELYEECGNE